MSSRLVLGIAGLVAVLAAGCGDDDADPAPTLATERSVESTPTSSTSPSTSPSVPPGTPSCASVWQDGATLPRPYGGCADQSGQYVSKDALACSSGQFIVRYDDRFYAVPGGTVHAVDAPLDRDSEYRAAALRCRA